VLSPLCLAYLYQHQQIRLLFRLQQLPQYLQIIQRIQAPLVGADIVEYNPTRDINGMTAVVCAKFLKEIAGKMLENSL